MPELNEQMYCSQQICIPPTFPYLLRQFAKAAIRTQPNDLLKWSTAYFRCLSLNIPPPVKPRLEYPIPRDYHGVTPGWLRALLYQLHPTETITFKTLWDRWIGAALLHPTLIQILCLGAFTDNQAVPWLRFIALCAAHLTDHLTNTMILICEVLTEEPEGGSAMIPVAVFIDLYRFLANIDAAFPQTLQNRYFLDRFLELYEERIARDAGPKKKAAAVIEAEVASVSSATTESIAERRKHDDISLVSCPSVPSEDPDNFLRLMEKMDEDMEEEGGFLPEKESSASTESKHEEDDLEEEVQVEEDTITDLEQPCDVERAASAAAGMEEAAAPSGVAEHEAQTLPVDEDELTEEAYLNKLSEAQGEYDEMAGGGGVMGGDLLGQAEVEMLKLVMVGEEECYEGEEGLQEGEDMEPKTPPYEDVYCDAIPGIGGIVPEELVNAVVAYMEKMAAMQHGMVMPRNIRHYECPPLHVYHD